MNLEQKISKWIKNYLENNNLSSLVVGISGGIDSAVTSTLCAMTGYETNAVIMPIHQNKDETARGIEHCKWLKKEFPSRNSRVVSIPEWRYHDIDTFDDWKRAEINKKYIK